MISFAGKTVLVTGAGGAIGAECAGLFAGLGARLVLTDSSADALGGVRASLACDAVPVARAADVTRGEQVDALRDEVEASCGGVDAMVLCAGIYRPAALTGMSDLEWRSTLEVNLGGVFNFIRAFAPRMPEGGAIVALSSVAQRGSASFAHYAASKSGLLGLVRSAALELAPRVRVNAISPGPIESPMVAPLMQRRGAEILAQTPLGRLGTPVEVARAAAFLASDWASYITGENLHMNGGLYMA
jgi:3-oxoacyl-[acyl-carrier protein] reductase